MRTSSTQSKLRAVLIDVAFSKVKSTPYLRLLMRTSFNQIISRHVLSYTEDQVQGLHQPTQTSKYETCTHICELQVSRVVPSSVSSKSQKPHHHRPAPSSRIALSSMTHMSNSRMKTSSTTAPSRTHFKIQEMPQHPRASCQWPTPR